MQYAIKSTPTLDYRRFGYKEIYQKVFLALWLMKNNLIDLSADAKELKKRCISIIIKSAKDYGDASGLEST